jgi:carbon storage regulator
MLVLSRKLGDKIRIGDDIIVTVVQMGHGNVRLGIEAPTQVRVLRAELHGEAAPKRPRLPAALTAG